MTTPHHHPDPDLANRVHAMWQVLRRPAPQLSLWQRALRKLNHQRRGAQIDKAIRQLRATGIVTRLEPFRGLFELPLSNNMTRRLLLGGYEATQQAIVEAIVKPGDHVLDVGANLGLFSVLCGSLVGPEGKVLGVEPVPNMLNHLHANLRRNYLNNVTVFEGVATDRRQTCQIHTIEGAEEYSSLRQIAHPDGQRGKSVTVAVEGVTVDELVLMYHLKPRVFKVDTEGAEGLVFSGAAATLQAYRPLILSELDDRLLKGFHWTSGRVIGVLKGAGYQVFDQNTRRPLAEETRDFVGDILGIPEELPVPPSE